MQSHAACSGEDESYSRHTGARARWSWRGSSAMVACPTAVLDSLLSRTAACITVTGHACRYLACLGAATHPELDQLCG